MCFLITCAAMCDLKQFHDSNIFTIGTIVSRPINTDTIPITSFIYFLAPPRRQARWCTRLPLLLPPVQPLPQMMLWPPRAILLHRLRRMTERCVVQRLHTDEICPQFFEGRRQSFLNNTGCYLCPFVGTSTCIGYFSFACIKSLIPDTRFIACRHDLSATAGNLHFIFSNLLQAYGSKISYHIRVTYSCGFITS